METSLFTSKELIFWYGEPEVENIYDTLIICEHLDEIKKTD